MKKERPLICFFLMLDPNFKTLHLVSSLIGHEQGKTIVKEYDNFLIKIMFFNCYYHLHPLIESKKGVVDQKVEVDKNLNIYEMTANTSEPTRGLVNRELIIFKFNRMLKTSNVH